MRKIVEEKCIEDNLGPNVFEAVISNRNKRNRLSYV